MIPQIVGTQRIWSLELTDAEIDDIVRVIKDHQGALPEHAERFLNEMNNR